MNSIAQQIELTTSNFPKGKIFFIDDFVGIGTSETVRQTLLRMVEAGKIIRVAQGVYCYPEIDEKLGLGVIYPTFDQIATALAEHQKARIVPTGDYALNTLGLSTQVPMNCVFLTDGKTRQVKIYNGHGIIFKNTAPRNLAFKNNLAMLVNSALKSIGQGNVTEEQTHHITSLLHKENKADVIADIKLMPEWIRKIVLKAYE